MLSLMKAWMGVEPDCLEARLDPMIWESGVAEGVHIYGGPDGHQVKVPLNKEMDP